jgi:trimeric autotransporter adhesin
VFGTASNTYTMPGITSAASRDAQSALIQVVTSDENGNLASAMLAGLGLVSAAAIGDLKAQIDDLNNRLNTSQQKCDAASPRRFRR